MVPARGRGDRAVGEGQRLEQALAAESVMRLGYSNVESMVDGVGGWKAHGYELVREEAPLLGLARSA